MGLIPDAEKLAYVEAKKHCSIDVLESEADPLRFLRFENYNAWSAGEETNCKLHK